MSRIIMPVIGIILIAGIIGGSGCIEEAEKELRPLATFFAVHMEARAVGIKGMAHLEWQERHWPHLITLVEMADKYDAKLTLEFNPQWAEYILADESRLELTKEWQDNGHEIALHYHTIWHQDWCGYTNRDDGEYTAHPGYRGAVPQMMELLNKLASPEKVVTSCIGTNEWSAKRPIEGEVPVDEVDFPDQIIYDMGGYTDGLMVPYEFMYAGEKRWHLRHHYLFAKRGHLEASKEEFESATRPDEVMGVVIHEFNVPQGPDLIEEWFKFVSEHGFRIRTVSDIMSEYRERYAEN
jgi:hypothetical protein